MTDPWEKAGLGAPATFGKLQESQGRKVLSDRPNQYRVRYKCGLCDEVFMSDEALQIHRQNHAFLAIAGELGRIIDKLEEVRNLLEGRL